MENIFKQLPSISQDTLQYYLYPPPELSNKVSVTTLAACIQTYVESKLPDFIWHRDSFELKLAQDPDQDKESWLLEGRMRVGDSVDDEWCAVWLLKEISSKWDVVISAFDSDGEFMLIEAAEALPTWVKPSNSENRVWIYQSRLHLIPLEHVSPPSRKRRPRELPGADEENTSDYLNTGDDLDEFIAAPDAIPLVRDPSTPTFATAAVESIVWARIKGYPGAARDHVHRTNAYLPIEIARALIKTPSLVQKAVETFYTRDAVQLRAAHRMSRFPPNTSTLSTVKMTRTAYAQLSGQKFYPPKVFGTWRESEGSKEWRWKDIGMKTAVGFEILYQESKTRSDNQATLVNAESTTSTVDSQRRAKIDALQRDKDYIQYIQNLNSVGYFREELEGSELWKNLEEKAAEMFIESRRPDDAKRVSFASQVNTACADTSVQPSAGEEDSDDWLNVDAENLDAMLEQALAPRTVGKTDTDMEVDKISATENPEERLASEQASKLKDLAERVEKFVEGEGGLEGALFEGEDELSDEEMDDSDDENGSESGTEAYEVPTVKERQAAMDKLVPSLDPGDYGKMPSSFYTSSQKVAKAKEGKEGDEIEADETIESPETKKYGSTTQEPEAPTRPVRKPILPRDNFDGVDSDDETDSEEEVDEDSEEDKPQVVGDVEIDMEDEEEEFLEFSRQALGISDEQWNQIIQDRRDRGAFLPASALKKSILPKTSGGNFPASTTTSQPTTGATPPPQVSSKPGANPNLDSFEAVMQAMDNELARLKRDPGQRKAGLDGINNGKGKSTAPAAVESDLPDVDMDDDGVISAMHEELMAALNKEGEEEHEDDEGEESLDYNMIKNFLESFRSQAGLSGPVSNLAGRLQPGWQLPRDS